MVDDCIELLHFSFAVLLLAGEIIISPFSPFFSLFSFSLQMHLFILIKPMHSQRNFSTILGLCLTASLEITWRDHPGNGEGRAVRIPSVLQVTS